MTGDDDGVTRTTTGRDDENGRSELSGAFWDISVLKREFWDTNRPVDALSRRSLEKYSEDQTSVRSSTAQSGDTSIAS